MTFQIHMVVTSLILLCGFHVSLLSRWKRKYRTILDTRERNGIKKTSGQDLRQRVKSRELLWLHVGQCGVQVAQELWKLLREDHHLDDDVFSSDKAPIVAFQLPVSGGPRPRNLCIDTDCSPIDDIMADKTVIASDSNLVKDMESSGSLYPRGMHSRVAGVARDKTRLLLETCDYPSGAVFVYGSGGGTGSGLTTHVSGRLFCDYPKLRQIHFVVTPSPAMRALPTSTVEAYNVGLMARDMSELTNCCCLLDNDAVYHICSHKKHVLKPDYAFINKILSMAILISSSGWRFNSSPSIKFDDLPTNLVINPRMKYALMSLAPVFHRSCFNYELLTVGDLTRELFQANSYLACCDPRAGAIAACISYRGTGISAVCVSEALGEQSDRGGAKFVPWVKPSFKTGITQVPIPSFLDMKLPRAACMLSNSRALAPNWGQICWVFNEMYRKKAFLHWYIAEGTEYADFQESSEALKCILEQYTAT